MGFENVQRVSPILYDTSAWKLTTTGKHHPWPISHGTQRQLHRSNGIHPILPYSPPLEPTTKSPSGIYPSSRTRTKRQLFNRQTPPTHKSHPNCSLFIKDKRMSRNYIGIPRSRECCSPPPPTRSTHSRRYRSDVLDLDRGSVSRFDNRMAILLCISTVHTTVPTLHVMT